MSEVAKIFNTTAVCVPEEHYMVNLESRLEEIKQLIDDGKYFTVNRARQYGKTTTLMALCRYLQDEYRVVYIDFQIFGSADFSTEYEFASSFANVFCEAFGLNGDVRGSALSQALEALETDGSSGRF